MHSVISRPGARRLGSVARLAVLTAALAGVVLATAPAASAAPSAGAAAPETIALTNTNRALANSAYPNSSQSDWTGSQGVGFVAVAGSPAQTQRLYFAFDTSGLAGRQIISAEFVARQTHSYSCEPRPLSLVQTGPISASTNWFNKPAVYRLLSTSTVVAGRPNCAPEGATVSFDATQAVAEAAATGSPVTTLGLQAQNEHDSLGWKKFGSVVGLLVTVA